MVSNMTNSKVIISNDGIEINGSKQILLVGSLFYFRLPRATWEQRIVDLKKLGYNAVDVYFPWNYHEQSRGVFDFDGEKDVEFFLQLLHKHNMYVVARPGPYICSEWNGGGLPARILSDKTMRIRTSDPTYLAEVKLWYDTIVPILAKYEIGKGGTVICMQLENELDFFDCDDVSGYVSALHRFAVNDGLTVPCIACAGQGGLVNCGGMVDGVVGTYNFYPSFSDIDFDYNCYRYAQALETRNLPLMVTETHRDHNILKRELLAGAKLLGAYNQVSGTNFGFYESVNNWGHGEHPESFITSDYDFGGVITALGDYTAEADKAILFACGLAVYGESLAFAKSIQNSEVKITADFTLPTYGGILQIGDGMLLGVTNCGQLDGNAHICVGKYAFDVFVDAQTTLMLPIDVSVDGINVMYSNAELIKIAGKLVFVTDSKPDICIKKDDTVVKICNNGEFLDGQVSVLSTHDALKRYKSECCGKISYEIDRTEELVSDVVVGTTKLGSVGTDLSFGANIDLFQKIYEIRGKAGNELFVEEVSDLVSVYSNDKYLYTESIAGKDLLLPKNGSGNYRLKVERWGYCNFDDPRRNNLYIQSSRGVKNVFVVDKKVKLNTMRFQQYNEWLPEKLAFTPSQFDPLLSVNSWNSTRVPLVAVYYDMIEKIDTYQKVYFIMQDRTCECALYIDDNLVGVISEATNKVDITPYVQGKGNVCLQLLVRKRVWTEQCGMPILLYLNSADVVVKDICGDDLCKMQLCQTKTTTLPLCIADGQSIFAQVDLSNKAENELMGIVDGVNYKLTVVCGDRVIARLVDPKQGKLEMQGGNPYRFYIPACWRNRNDDKLKIYAESIGHDCSFTLRLQSIGERR